jgi:hypothetical protein
MKMSDDIVERLRTFDIYDYADADKICREAAARIKSQAARIETLEAALKRIEDTDPDEGTPWFHEVARAALAGSTK